MAVTRDKPGHRLRAAIHALQCWMKHRLDGGLPGLRGGHAPPAMTRLQRSDSPPVGMALPPELRREDRPQPPDRRQRVLLRQAGPVAAHDEVINAEKFTVA